MKAITIYDPWATLAALKQKKYETRDWPTKYRGPIAIHAAKSTKPWHMDFAWDEPFYSALKERHHDFGVRFFPGCILTICNLTDCQQVVSLEKENGKPILATLENGETIEGDELFFGDYTPGRYAWKLENVQSLAEPIPAKGHQQLWNWDETPHMVAIDPWVIGPTKIWTPRGVCSGKRIAPGKEDSMIGLEVMA